MKKIPDHAKLVFKGILHDVYHWDQELYDGTITTFEGLRRKNSVTIIPVTCDLKILVNFEEQPNHRSFVCVPGGGQEDGETLLETAKRELEEETGYIGDSWEEWNVYDTLNYAKFEWDNYFFIARNSLPDGKVCIDGGEKITTKLVVWEEFLEVVKREDFRNWELKKFIQNSTDKQLIDFKELLFKKL